MSITDGEIQEAAAIEPFLPLLALFIRDGGDERVQLLDGLEHSLPEDGMTETLSVENRGIGIIAHAIQHVEEESEGPFAVGAAADAAEPALVESHGEAPLDVFPAADVAVVHPHQAVVVKRVAVGVGEGALGGGADVGED